jgi:hypothetical protein
VQVRSGETPRSPVVKPPCVVERPEPHAQFGKGGLGRSTPGRDGIRTRRGTDGTEPIRRTGYTEPVRYFTIRLSLCSPWIRSLA